MKKLMSNLLQNRITSVSVLLLVLMTAALGQSLQELNATKNAPACGQKCSLANPCKTAACPVCVLISTASGVCKAN
jgi:hypothetical protein